MSTVTKTLLGPALIAAAFSVPLEAPRATEALCRAGVNCIANPSLETAPSGADALPDRWNHRTFGKSDAKFSIVEGRTGAKAASVAVGSFAGTQDAKWYFDFVPVVGGQYYRFTDWYKSTKETEIFAYFEGSKTTLIRLAVVPPSPKTWTQTTVSGFIVPDGATSMTVGHTISGAGTLTTDDYALELAPAPLFEQGLVSITFDDAWQSVYANAVPILDHATSDAYPDGLKSTQFVITDPVVRKPTHYLRNMTIAEIAAMEDEGHEIGAHSRTHIALVEGAASRKTLTSEIVGSRDDLLQAGIGKVDTFAYPFGKYDETAKAIVAGTFTGARGTANGFNVGDADNFALKTMSVTDQTKPDEVVHWINQALAQKSWLILTFHRVEKTFEDCARPSARGEAQMDDDCTDVATLSAVADYLKDTPEGTVVTVSQGLERLAAIREQPRAPSN